MPASLSINLPQRLTLSGTPGNMTKLEFPTGAIYARIRFIGAEGFVAFVGVDGAAIGSDFETCSADVTIIRAIDAVGLVLVAGSAPAQIVEVTALSVGQ